MARWRFAMISIVCLLFLVFNLQARQVPAARAASLPNGFKSIGYMPSWAGDVNSIQYSKITHINYAFLLANADGSLRSLDNPGKLQSMVTLAHNNNVKVFISVGGWSGSSVDATFEALGASPTARANFINNMVNFVNQYNLDGVDIDWEYPKASSAGNYSALMSGLSTAMHSRGKLLTAAVVSDGSAADGVAADVFGYVDWLNIMAYDGGEPHANYDWSINSLNFWLNRGLPASKAVLGVPFYARPGESFTYAQAVAANRDNANRDCATVNGVYGCYNGQPTIRRKTQYLLTHAAGIMYWEMSQDTKDSTSLVSTIYDTVMGNSGPTATPTPNPNGTNIARGRNATASSTEASSYGASLAVDGNNSTRWSSAWTNPQWLQVDLGSSYALNRVILNWEAAYARGYQVQVSNDANNWQTIYSTSNGDGGSDNLSLNGTGRYLRVYTTAKATEWGVSLFELEAYGTPANSPTATPRPNPTATSVPNPTATPRPNPTATPTTGTPAWQPNTAYAAGAKVSYAGKNYTCLQAHTSLVGWEPANVPALWQQQ
ncbi:glycosyl hydrolase family 18 protein [Herpetosiphon giganteus]|uniref:glycosyl hydrolase family 18 protein n=1 Tax=Herpetosiphon giganteus TaxID=2029754 RepID=UPI00195BD5F0|nr:glycosyl hydrolase family 18 protein [Herpetosiphon giganteus]MBM7843577.1 GH18 family chitinase [Herpetosiphon giganteus]